MTLLANVKTKQFGTHIDVFFSQEGWEPWARFKIKKVNNKIQLEHEEGYKVPSNVYQHALKQVRGK